jgi:hypothetical protein
MDRVEPTPDSPDKGLGGLFVKPSVKPATPDIIQFNEEEVPIEFITQLLFEDIGGIEILSVARSQIINGINISNNLIANSSELANIFSPQKFFSIPGNLRDTFENFPIKLFKSIPSFGSAPSRFYIGEKDSLGCEGFPVLRKRDDELVLCFNSLQEAESFVAKDKNPEVVYLEEDTGNLIVSVKDFQKKNRVQVEILLRGEIKNDTIY